ncbi:holin [Arthrobacter phage Joann]|uniref:Holin n=1 Tax=Arthrobacter phage Joann TaxID=1772303 RepID=A0A0U4JBW0_9CAUD|nr:holin [Arthrobacter phage Joann]ALY09429.1 holin [Arthrobacter phage Joann]
MAQAMITFNVDWWAVLQLVLSAVLPLVVGLITTRMTAGTKKSILLLALSVLTSFLTQLLSWWFGGHSEPYDLFSALLLALATFVIGVGLHVGAYSSKNADGTSIASRLADKGITADTPDFGPTFAEQFPSLHAVTETTAPNVGLPKSYLHLEAEPGDLAAFVNAPGPKHKA